MKHLADTEAATPIGVAERLRKLTRLQMQRQRLLDELTERIEQLRVPFVRRIEALDVRVAALNVDIEAYCCSGRDDLFPSGRRSLKTPYGTVAFRRSVDSVRCRDGVTDAEACAALRSERLGRFVRTKESPDHTALRRALHEGRLTCERAARCGLELHTGAETFRCDVHDRDAPGGRE
jgi:phage host-nuclease inhibitor protein Gam